MKHYKPVEIL